MKQSSTQVHQYPGFLIRRLQQVSNSIFLARLRKAGITPLQYTILRIVQNNPGSDQISVAKTSVLDASTTTDVIRRLEVKRLIRRQAGKTDRRTKTVYLTSAGNRTLALAAVNVHAAQTELLAPLSQGQRKTLLQMIGLLLDKHEVSRNGGSASGPWRRSDSRPATSS